MGGACTVCVCIGRDKVSSLLSPLPGLQVLNVGCQACIARLCDQPQVFHLLEEMEVIVGINNRV